MKLSEYYKELHPLPEIRYSSEQWYFYRKLKEIEKEEEYPERRKWPAEKAYDRYRKEWPDDQINSRSFLIGYNEALTDVLKKLAKKVGLTDSDDPDHFYLDGITMNDIWNILVDE